MIISRCKLLASMIFKCVKEFFKLKLNILQVKWIKKCEFLQLQLVCGKSKFFAKLIDLNSLTFLKLDMKLSLMIFNMTLSICIVFQDNV